jgi:hypothetical protein
MKLATGTCPYRLEDLNKECALMAMLRALPCGEFGNFTSSLIRQMDILTCGDVEAVFQEKQTKHNTHHGPRLSMSGDATLCARYQDELGIKYDFCTGEGHDKDTCYKKDCARKDAQKAVKEHRANRNGAKPHRANCAAASSPPAPLDSAKITELTARAGVCFACLPDTQPDVHCVADTGV